MTNDVLREMCEGGYCIDFQDVREAILRVLDELDALSSRVRELEGALKPFADASAFREKGCSSKIDCFACLSGAVSQLTIEQFKTARALLEKQ